MGRARNEASPERTARSAQHDAISPAIGPLAVTARRVAKWFVAGAVSLALGLPLLYVLVSLVGIDLTVATLIGGELGLLFRYALNDRWVFSESRSSWRRLRDFHVASAGGFAVLWFTTNAVARLDVHYLLATVVGTLASLIWTLTSSFLWVWRHPRARPASSP